MLRMFIFMAIVQAVPTKAATLLGRHVQQSIHNVASYLGTYMLGCCQVFAASSAATARLPVQPKVQSTPLLFQMLLSFLLHAIFLLHGRKSCCTL